MCCSYKDKYDIAVPFRELEELEREELTSDSSVKYYREGTVKESALGGEERVIQRSCKHTRT